MKAPWIFCFLVAIACTKEIPETRPFDLLTDHTQVKIVLQDNIQNGPDLFCHREQSLKLNVALINQSPFEMFSDPKVSQNNRYGTNISYRLFSLQNPKTQRIEGQRTLLPTPLAGVRVGNTSQADLNLVITCPDYEEPLELRIEVVQEGRAWLSDLGIKDQYISVILHPLKLDEFEPNQHIVSKFFQNVSIGELPLPHHPEQALSHPKRSRGISPLEVTKAAKMALGLIYLHSYILNFGSRSVLVLNAGSQYPMVWARDMATMDLALKNFMTPYGASYLTHWSKIFLDETTANDGTPDWIEIDAAQHKVIDKNDIQADQELWTILSLLENAKDPFEYKSQVATALNWLIDHRYDSKAGCFYSGHTMDWGDVGLSGKDSASSTKIASGFPLVCGIFLQSLAFQVFEKLAAHSNWNEFLKTQGIDSASFVKNVSQYAHSRLWSGQYFRIHEHLEVFSMPNEANLFALGGNTLAALSQLASPQEAEKIKEEILVRQKHMKASTISGVLFPAYPKNTFANPIMGEPYTYQNGGQWDWWGARAATLFKGDPHGWGVLAEIAKKVVHNGTFYEWEKLDGSPGAGPHFRAGAAAFLYAYLEFLSVDLADVK